MRLKVTLEGAGPATDLVVTADATVTVGDVARAIMDRHPAGLASPSAATASATLMVSPPAFGTWRVLPGERALGEAGVASGYVVRVVDGATRAPTTDAAVMIRVVSGPDTGREFTAAAGDHVIGRDAACDIVLSDPMVSKRHARLIVDSRVELVDLASANGVLVDGSLVPRLTVTDRQTAWLGDTELAIIPARTAERATEVSGGSVPFIRSPRVEARHPGAEHRQPPIPVEKDAPRFPWLSLIAPVVMGLAMFAILGSPLSLLFIAMAPLMAIGSWVDNRATRAKHIRDETARFERDFAALATTLEEARAQERAGRLAEIPSAAEVQSEAMRLGALLWTRRPEHWSFLALRLGVGTALSRHTVTATEPSGVPLPGFAERVDALGAHYRDIDGVPLVEGLPEAGALGVAGPLARAAPVARGLLVQLLGLHSPAEVVVTAFAGPQSVHEFAWLGWMPHTSSPQSPVPGAHLADNPATGQALLAALEAVIAARDRAQEGRRGPVAAADAVLQAGAEVGDAASRRSTAPLPAVIVLIAADTPVDTARLVQMAERGPDAGVYPVWLAPERSGLPAACRTWIEVSDGAPATIGFVRTGIRSPAEVEEVELEVATAFAKRLAPVVDLNGVVSDDSDLPATVSLLDILGSELAESPHAAVERWRQNGSVHDRSGRPPAPRPRSGLRGVVGLRGADPMHLDLRSDGPHALVGGTTGSGKSEFLQSWVLATAAEYSPDRVTFLFVDYKGGSAFADCVRLPHAVGLVTDLSPHLVRRALVSLRAELLYREHLLSVKKAKDLIELERRGDIEAPPALVLMIDEFAALVADVPEFIDGVVDIAQRGRSLGIHLVVATQRPAGVIRDNLRANTNLRIALRMADEHDSTDVVGDPVAAGFDPALPGRAVAKTGPGRLSPFQSAYVGGWSSSAPRRADLRIAEFRFGTETEWRSVSPQPAVAADADPGPTDQARLVANLTAAATAVDIPAPRRPWLDPLGDAYEMAQLGQRSDTELVVGVVDRPEIQAQEVVHFRPDVEGHLAVYGTGGSGKSTLLRTLAIAAGISPQGGPVDVYALDFGGGGLRMLRPLPHVGAVIPGDDSDRVVRLLRMLSGVLDERGRSFPEVNAATITEYRALAGEAAIPRILLLVDGFGAFREEYETPAARAPWYAVFQQILTEGRQLGIHVALSADRPGAVPTAVSSAIQQRVALRLADEGGYHLLDVPADVLGPTSPPGRAIIDDREAQVAVLGGTRSTLEQATAIERLAGAMARAGRTPAPEIGSLPLEYPASGLPAEVDGLPVLGLSDETLGPLGFQPFGAFLLAGGPGSGRSTALAAIAAALARWHPGIELHYLGHRRSRLPGRPWWASVATSVDDVAVQARVLAARIAEDQSGASHRGGGGGDCRLPSDTGGCRGHRTDQGRPPQRPLPGRRIGDEHLVVVVAVAGRGEGRPSRCGAPARHRRGRPAAAHAVPQGAAIRVPAWPGVRGAGTVPRARAVPPAGRHPTRFRRRDRRGGRGTPAAASDAPLVCTSTRVQDREPHRPAPPWRRFLRSDEHGEPQCHIRRHEPGRDPPGCRQSRPRADPPRSEERGGRPDREWVPDRTGLGRIPRDVREIHQRHDPGDRRTRGPVDLSPQGGRGDGLDGRGTRQGDQAVAPERAGRCRGCRISYWTPSCCATSTAAWR